MENIQTPTFINEGEIVLNDENYTIRFSFINNILCTILTYKGETIHNLKDGEEELLVYFLLNMGFTSTSYCNSLVWLFKLVEKHPKLKNVVWNLD